MSSLINHVSRINSSPDKEISTPSTKKRKITDDDEVIQPVREEQRAEINQTVNYNVYVHKFGVDNDKAVAEVTLSELLLLASSKGLHFKIAEKGKGTFQNFQCYTGEPPTILRADEARVRNALTLLQKHTDPVRRAILWSRQPKPNTKVTAWNIERQKIATDIQDEVIDALSAEEKSMAANLKVKIQKRPANTISTVIGRYDKLALDKKQLSNKKLKSQMSQYLSKTPIQPSSSLPSSSLPSSSLPSSSSSTSSYYNFCRLLQK